MSAIGLIKIMKYRENNFRSLLKSLLKCFLWVKSE